MCKETRAALKMERRSFLAHGLGAGLVAMSPAALDAPPGMRAGRPEGGRASAEVPPTTVSLAAYGGVPGAGRAVLVRAFGQALAALARCGGGTLFVPAGLYDFGSDADGAYVIFCRNLRNIAISAYGATFRVTTSVKAVPTFFYFFNFHNITIAGASFTDPGFTPWVNWKGMYCVGIQADQASSRFRMVDCHAERVVGLLASNNNAATRRFISGVSVHGTVAHAYYGVGASNLDQDVKVELACHNVRRAFIAAALKRADIAVTSTNTPTWPGSNGLVALVAGGASAGNVEDVRVRVRVSGACIHSSYVHFYHQGREREGHMRDIDATVEVVGAMRVRNLFVFDHEDEAVRPETSRVWDRIALHGKLAGKFAGRVISNPSVTTSPGTVYVDRNLAQMQGVTGLPAGFRVAAPR